VTQRRRRHNCGITGALGRGGGAAMQQSQTPDEKGHEKIRKRWEERIMVILTVAGERLFPSK
jgi:hypothetical protein